MHNEVGKALNDLYLMKKSIDSILSDHKKQVYEVLSKKLVGLSVHFNYNKNVVKVGVIRRVVIISDNNVYVEVGYDEVGYQEKLSQLSTNDLTFL